jgi:uncharacterized C2H2 Zn-finger protein
MDESEPFELIEPELFPIANDEDLLEADELNWDSSWYEKALEQSKDIEFEPEYQQLLCSTCNITFNSATNYMDHQAVCHGRSLVYCPLCVVFFSNHTELRQHWRDIHARDFRSRNIEPRNKILKRVYANLGLRKEPLWKCNICDKSFHSIIEFRYIIFLCYYRT